MNKDLPVASGHQHTDSCYKMLQKCGQREHTDHSLNCFNDKGKRVCRVHAHKKKCYKKVLVCGRKTKYTKH